MAWDRDAFENAMIDEMRANGGKVVTGPLAGQSLLILHSIGAKSGQERRAILTWSRDGGDYVVAGTAGGSPTTPAWVHNLEAPRRRDDRGGEPGDPRDGDRDLVRRRARPAVGPARRAPAELRRRIRSRPAGSSR